MKLSVIVPVFKVEDYLERCIESILEQMTDQCEIILVDDGSPDQCPQICDRYCEQYSQISVIHQKNQGLSSARNTGMRNVKGEFLLFLDSDDILLPGALQAVEAAIAANSTTDAFFFSYNEMNDDRLIGGAKGIVPDVSNGIYSIASNEAQKLVSECLELWPAWRIVVKKSFIDKSNLAFAVGVIHEDVDWTARILLSANTIGIFDTPIIGYRVKRAGAITETIKYKSFDHTYAIVKNLLEDMSHSKNNEVKDHLRVRLSQACFSMLRAWNNCNHQEKELFCNRLTQCRKLLSYSQALQHRLFYMILRLCGAKIAINIYSRIVK